MATCTVVLNQLGPDVGETIRSEVGEVEVLDVPAEPEAAVAEAGEVLLAAPRFDLPRCRLQSQRVPWAQGIRWVHTATAGVDAYPLSLLRDRVVTCNRGAMSAAIAEFVLAAILADLKRLPAAWQPDATLASLAPLGTLEGATVGIIGFGSIGEALARRTLPFGARVLATRRTIRPASVDGVVLTDLDTVVAHADHLVLAVPATRATSGLVDGRLLAKVKPGVHLVNVARGSVVDQDALVLALDRGTVRLATLDVTEPEPLPSGHLLRRHPKVRLSPHVSWSTPGVRERGVTRFIENLRRYLAARPLLGVVDVEQGY